MAPFADYMGSGEDMELMAKKEKADMERIAAMRKKQQEEEAKKAERQEKGAKEFKDWVEYIPLLKLS